MSYEICEILSLNGGLIPCVAIAVVEYFLGKQKRMPFNSILEGCLFALLPCLLGVLLFLAVAGTNLWRKFYKLFYRKAE